MGVVDFLFDDADEVIQNIILHESNAPAKKSSGGSKIGKSPNRERDLDGGHQRIIRDYFSENPVYPEEVFRRRFRMSSRLFRRLLREIPEQHSYFLQKLDAVGKPGASPVQKLTASLRMLAYGIAADAIDEYVRLSETTVLRSMKEFCFAVIAIYGEHYLRHPNSDDIRRLQEENSARGFPGMLGSVDCMHWSWKNCPKAWHGQMVGKDGEASLVLEAIATHDLHIWHAFFGMPGSCNDINIMDRSPLMSDIITGKIPPSEFTISGVEFKQGYYLADGIYPPWPIFVQGFSQPDNEMKRSFTAMQESARKDVERAFGVLKQRWHIIARPSNLWLQSDMKTVITACIILHNMIVEDQRGEPFETFEDAASTASVRPYAGRLEHFVGSMSELRCRDHHYDLRNVIMQYQWDCKGRQTQ